MKEDKAYIVRKIMTMITCIAIIVTVGLTIIGFQSKSVTINYYGSVIKIKTMSNTIEGLLMQNNIYIDEKAVVYPNIETRIKDNMEIKIYSEEEYAILEIDKYIELATTNVTEKIVQEIQYIDYKTEQKSNSSKDRGTSKTLKDGEQGQRTITYAITYNGDKEIAKTTLNEEVTKEVVNKIIEVGTKVTTSSRNGTISPKPSASDFEVDAGFKQYNIKLSVEKQKYAYNMCKKYGVEYELLLALMYVESGYNAKATGSGGAIGMCQIMSSNLSYLRRNIGTTNLYDPYQNIKAGAYWLSRYIKSWSNEATGETLYLHALNSYNWGEGGYRRYLRKGNNASSWYYGKRIVAIKNRLIANGGL